MRFLMPCLFFLKRMWYEQILTGGIRMQLKMMTDYTIRILLYMKAEKSDVTLSQISKDMGITVGPLQKALRRLRDEGWIKSFTGSEGGWRLVKDVEKISLLDIMKITEDTIRFNRCLEDDQFCSRNAVGVCPVHDVYKNYQQMTEAYFSSVTIGDLLKPKEEHSRHNK